MPDKKNILLVDDDYDMHTICRKYIELGGYNFVSALSGQEGLQQITQGNIDLIILDYLMPEMNGDEFYHTLIHDEKYKDHKDVPVIMLTILTEDRVDKEKLLNMGITLFLQKPFGYKELMSIIDNVIIKFDIQKKQTELGKKKIIDVENLTVENKKLKEQIQETYNFDKIIAISKSMCNIITKITKVAKTDANVLIHGEDGTGKEFIARCIHANSKRKENSFYTVDCSALPPALLESELFGYEKGTFTGVTQHKKGLFEQGYGGTLFMNDIGALNNILQTKLLKVLQQRQMKRLGGKNSINVNIRIISATNKTMIENEMRQDLYYRLNVAPIHLPPLRERKEDIPLLANHFIKEYCNIKKKKMMRLSSDAISCLKKYHWSGNVRELQILMERVVSVNNKVIINLKDLPAELQENYELQTKILSSVTPLKQTRKKWIEKFEKSYLLNLLTKCNGNISKVAKLAQVNRMTIYRMMNTYNISFKRSTTNHN